MIDQPDINAYSLPARICLGIAIFGSPLLVAVLASIYLIRPPSVGSLSRFTAAALDQPIYAVADRKNG
jgi:hypothetical protein